MNNPQSVTFSLYAFIHNNLKTSLVQETTVQIPFGLKDTTLHCRAKKWANLSNQRGKWSQSEKGHRFIPAQLDLALFITYNEPLE